MRKLISKAVFFLSFLLLSPVASADLLSANGNSPGSMSLSFAGGKFYFDQDRQMLNEGTGAVILGFNFSQRWGIEALMANFTTHFKSVVNDDRRIHASVFAIDGVYHFNCYQPWVPFILAGVGVLGVNHNQNEANNQGNLNAGLGLEYFFERNLALRADVRDFWTITGAKNDVMWDVGFTFLFDLC